MAFGLTCVWLRLKPLLLCLLAALYIALYPDLCYLIGCFVHWIIIAAGFWYIHGEWIS